MVLLKSITSKRFNSLVANLHSTMVLLKSGISKSYIYALCKSTFHYGSIKMIERCKQTGTTKTSTFHYGSIKITLNNKKLGVNN